MFLCCCILQSPGSMHISCSMVLICSRYYDTELQCVLACAEVMGSGGTSMRGSLFKLKMKLVKSVAYSLEDGYTGAALFNCTERRRSTYTSDDCVDIASGQHLKNRYIHDTQTLFNFSLNEAKETDPSLPN